MAKFNSKVESTKVTNHMGAPAFVDNPEFALVSLLLTSFVHDKYYESSSDEIKRLRGLLAQVDPKFAAQAAVYARNEFGMRSVSHVTAAEVAKAASGKPWARSFYNAVIRRPDDMLEIVSYHFANGNKRLSSAMQAGFRMAFDKFDAYQLAKYRGEKRKIKLIDVLRMVHPKGTQKNADALKQLVEGTLRSTGTWEAKLTEAGKTATSDEEKIENKKEAWAELLTTGKIGQFALLRNLRNIIETAPDMIDRACELLTSESRNRKSLILPFRFLTAYEEIEKVDKPGKFESQRSIYKKVLDALETAVNQSIANLPDLPGQTVILVDNSGSMTGDGGGSSAVSANSKTSSAAIANLFGAMYWMKSNDTIVGLFGDRLLYPELDRKAGLFENYKKLAETASKVGGGTETGIFTMFQRMVDEKMHVDRVVVFSDCQIGTGCAWYTTPGYGKGGAKGGDDFNKLFEQYRAINPYFNAYSVNIRAYGNTVFGPGVIKLAGWSEKIFDIMRLFEQDKNALINTIKAIEF